jgi:hypothetical protein
VSGGRQYCLLLIVRPRPNLLSTSSTIFALWHQRPRIMIQDDEDALLFRDDASDTFLCMDEEHGAIPHEGCSPDQGTQLNEEELDDTLLMDDELEDPETISMMQVAQVHNVTPFHDSHLGSGFDSDSDHLDLFEDQYISSGILHEDDAEDQLDILDSEDIDIEDDDQNDDR